MLCYVVKHYEEVGKIRFQFYNVNACIHAYYPGYILQTHLGWLDYRTSHVRLLSLTWLVIARKGLDVSRLFNWKVSFCVPVLKKRSSQTFTFKWKSKCWSKKLQYMGRYIVILMKWLPLWLPFCLVLYVVVLGCIKAMLCVHMCV